MPNTTQNGKVKHYNRDRGIGRISSHQSGNYIDYFFHISDVIGPDAPKLGDHVIFCPSHNTKGPKAIQIEIIKTARYSDQPFNITAQERATPANKSKSKRLTGFPCIRGEKIEGFVVERDLGRVAIGAPWFMFQDRAESVHEARERLISKARSKGANAIFGFYWHCDNERDGDRTKKLFWAEGRAVFLVPE